VGVKVVLLDARFKWIMGRSLSSVKIKSGYGLSAGVPFTLSFSYTHELIVNIMFGIFKLVRFMKSELVSSKNIMSSGTHMPSSSIVSNTSHDS